MAEMKRTTLPTDNTAEIHMHGHRYEHVVNPASSLRAFVKSGTGPLRKQGGKNVYKCMRDTEASHLPISKTIKMIFKFFSPGFTSFIKNTASFWMFDILKRVGNVCI